jgi:hypothetical protein
MATPVIQARIASFRASGSIICFIFILPFILNRYTLLGNERQGADETQV